MTGAQYDTVSEYSAKVAVREHVVSQGDTLYSISKRYGVTIESIRALNSIDGNNIKVGQVILLSPKDRP